MLEIVGNGGVWHRAKSGHPSITWKGPLRQAWSETDPFNPPTYFREEPLFHRCDEVLEVGREGARVAERTHHRVVVRLVGRRRRPRGCPDGHAVGDCLLRDGKLAGAVGRVVDVDPMEGKPRTGGGGPKQVGIASTHGGSPGRRGSEPADLLVGGPDIHGDRGGLRGPCQGYGDQGPHGRSAIGRYLGFICTSDSVSPETATAIHYTTSRPISAPPSPISPIDGPPRQGN